MLTESQVAVNNSIFVNIFHYKFHDFIFVSNSMILSTSNSELFKTFSCERQKKKQLISELSVGDTLLFPLEVGVSQKAAATASVSDPGKRWLQTKADYGY